MIRWFISVLTSLLLITNVQRAHALFASGPAYKYDWWLIKWENYEAGFSCGSGVCSVRGLGTERATITSFCSGEKSNGFQWSGGEWVPTRFKADSKYLAKKINPDSLDFKGKAMFETPFLCNDMHQDVLKVGPHFQESAKQACYLITRHGEAPIIFNAEKCWEKYSPENQLIEVQCKEMWFSPNGLFVRPPSTFSMDTSKNPPSGSKDSLTIEVDTCSKINWHQLPTKRRSFQFLTLPLCQPIQRFTN